MLNRSETEENPYKNLSLMDRIRRKYDLTPSIMLVLGLTTLFFVVFLIYPLLYVFKEAFWIKNRFTFAQFKLMATDPNIRELVINSFQCRYNGHHSDEHYQPATRLFLDALPLPRTQYLTRCYPNSDDYATLRRRDRDETVFQEILGASTCSSSSST